MTHARVALFEAPDEELTVVDLQVGPLAEAEIRIRVAGGGICQIGRAHV